MTTVSTLDLFDRASRIIGERSGTIASVTPITVDTVAYQDVVLTGVVNTQGDDTYYGGDRLMFVATDGTLGEALVTLWTDLSGTARIIAQTPAPDAGGRYILIAREDFTLNEYRYALSKDLNETTRTYRQVVRLTPNLDIYPLDMCDWLTGAGDIDAVWISESPNMLHNEDFSLWQEGAAAAPDGWTLSSGTIARTSTGTRSSYGAAVTAGVLVQPLPRPLVQWLTKRKSPVYTPLRAAVWMQDASAGRVGIWNGTVMTWSDPYTGTPNHFAEVSYTPTESDTAYEIRMDGTFTANAAVFMQSTATASNVYVMRDQGSQGYQEQYIPKAIRNVGGIPSVEMAWPSWTPWQLIVYVRRPFPAYSSDEDVYESQYARVLTAGLVNFLLEPVKPNQDRGRLDRIRTAQAGIWSRMQTNIVDLPVAAIPSQWQVGGIV